MTEQGIKKELQKILDETEDMEKFREQWDLTQDSLYPFAVGFMRAAIKFVLNDGEIIID